MAWFNSSMEISQAALAEFIELYKAEFNEDIDPDEALIMARNLVMFYDHLHEKGIAYAAEDNLTGDRPSEPSVRK